MNGLRLGSYSEMERRGFLKNKVKVVYNYQGGWGHWAIYYTSPQKLIMFSNYFLGILNFEFLVHLDECLQQLIVIHRKDNLVFHNWGCASIYWQ